MADAGGPPRGGPALLERRGLLRAGLPPPPRVECGGHRAARAAADGGGPGAARGGGEEEEREEEEEGCDGGPLSARTSGTASTATPGASPCIPKYRRRPPALSADPGDDGARRPTLLQRRREGAGLKILSPIDCVSARDNLFTQSARRNVEDNFELLEALGQGTTGCVYRARRRADDERVALKVMRMEDEELLAIARNEYEILRTIEHPNVVQALDFFTYRMGAVLVLEFFEGQTLESAVREAPRQRLRERPEAVCLFAGLAQAIAHLHAMRIIHRDVKAANMLVSNDLRSLKLIDFNTARCVLEGALTMTGTADYLPPEVLLGESLSEAGDVWAAGLCLHLMLSGNLPYQRLSFATNRDFGLAVRSRAGAPLSGDGAPCPDLSEACGAVLRGCLEIDPQLRLSAAELLETAWVAGWLGGEAGRPGGDGGEGTAWGEEGEEEETVRRETADRETSQVLEPAPTLCPAHPAYTQPALEQVL